MGDKIPVGVPKRNLSNDRATYYLLASNSALGLPNDVAEQYLERSGVVKSAFADGEAQYATGIRGGKQYNVYNSMIEGAAGAYGRLILNQIYGEVKYGTDRNTIRKLYSSFAQASGAHTSVAKIAGIDTDHELELFNPLGANGEMGDPMRLLHGVIGKEVGGSRPDVSREQPLLSDNQLTQAVYMAYRNLQIVGEDLKRAGREGDFPEIYAASLKAKSAAEVMVNKGMVDPSFYARTDAKGMPVVDTAKMQQLDGQLMDQWWPGRANALPSLNLLADPGTFHDRGANFKRYVDILGDTPFARSVNGGQIPDQMYNSIQTAALRKLADEYVANGNNLPADKMMIMQAGFTQTEARNGKPYYDSTIDGINGRGTRNAAKQFLRENPATVTKHASVESDAHDHQGPDTRLASIPLPEKGPGAQAIIT